jgi:hypothetical protein
MWEAVIEAETAATPMYTKIWASLEASRAD